MKRIAWIVSFSSAVAMIMFGYIIFPGTTASDELFFFVVISAVFPLTIVSYMDYKWRKAVDEHLPDLFRSIVQAQETGMTLPQALEDASKRDYGPLTSELKKMTTQISWGMTFEEALLALEKRVDTVLIRRATPLIIEAGRSGGNVGKVFGPLGKYVQTSLLINKRRQSQTRPYIAIIYVAFFAFLLTIILLFKSFFTSIEGLPILGSEAMAPEEMKRIFFHLTSIEAFFGGLIAGKMGEGTIYAGLKHSLILMICGYMALKLFL